MSAALARNLTVVFGHWGRAGSPECQHWVMTSGADSEGQLYPACFASSISAVLINIELLWKGREGADWGRGRKREVAQSCEISKRERGWRSNDKKWVVMMCGGENEEVLVNSGVHPVAHFFIVPHSFSLLWLISFLCCRQKCSKHKLSSKAKRKSWSGPWSHLRKAMKMCSKEGVFLSVCIRGIILRRQQIIK